MADKIRGTRTWQLRVPGGSGRAGAAAGIGVGIFLLFFATIWLGVTTIIALASGTLRAVFDDALVRVDGQVVDLVRERMSEGGTGCRSVVEYVGVDGSPGSVVDSVTRSPCQRIGADVRVLLDPDRPTWASIDPVGGFLGWFLGAFALVGVLVLVGAIVTLVRSIVALRRVHSVGAGAYGGTVMSTPGATPPSDHAATQAASGPENIGVAGHDAYAGPPPDDGPPSSAGSGARIAPPLF
ncbi:hypothetical protein ACTVCO_04010 [Sanguibacter sp. A247]|uniref:hypothetical protein n=1 Tax=unclassified Sanguibacter TaxID=2645534 RepID=UPI003FD8E9AF